MCKNKSDTCTKLKYKKKKTLIFIVVTILAKKIHVQSRIRILDTGYSGSTNVLQLHWELCTLWGFGGGGLTFE